MKKTKILLATLFILVFFFSIISVEKTEAVVSLDTYGNINTVTTDPPYQQKLESSTNQNIMLGGGASNYDLLNSNTGGTAADKAAYQAELKKLYTGYGSSTTAQSPTSAAASGCIGSFIGSWVGGQASNAIGSILPSSVADALRVPITNPTQNFREETLNGIAFCIGNALIDAMSASIVQWINNGFKNPDGTNGPAFLSNPDMFFKQIMNQEVGAFFQSMGPIGKIICNPFDLKIRLALLNQYNGGMRQQQCSLDNIKQNWARFGQNGNYMSDWFQLTQQDQNNAMGSYFIARDQMASNIKNSVDQKKTELDQGKGFLSLKKCVKYSTTVKDPNTGKAKCAEWQTTTPGAEVQASLDRAMGSKTHRIEIATNFNQIVSALVNQIIIQAMSGLSGGMNSGGGGGGSNKNNFDNNYDYGYTNINDMGGTIVATTSTATTSTSTHPFDSGAGLLP